MPILPPFDQAPEMLARRLLVGGSGPGLIPARDAALAAGPDFADLADALSLAVWEGAPFCPEAAALLAARHQRRSFLSPSLVQPVAAVVAATRPTTADPYFDRLAARRDIPKMLAYLLERHRKTPDDPTILHRLAVFAPMARPSGDVREVEAAFLKLSGPVAPLGTMLAAELALLDGRADAAVAYGQSLLAVFSSDSVRLGLAAALLRQGGRDAALAELAAVGRSRPWDVLALCRLHDVATGFCDRLTPLPGSVAVLLYSYNNAPLLDRALAALADTDWRHVVDTGGARIFALDNGSRDDTAAVLAAWRERLGERLRVVSLPVNVGAPAARNWLASLPEVRAADFVAYLDDDAYVPTDWLGRFGAAVAAMPEAGVWGCLIRGLDAPQFVQCADSHLFPTLRRDEDLGRAFDLAKPWLVTPDLGQYAVCRPCASVTGCCHLFRTSVLTSLGGFDIRFSPSQYDDLDHDLRLLLVGRIPVCQGHLAVIHAKVTGLAGNPGGAQYGSGYANQLKLHHKYDDAAVLQAAGAAFAALADDAARKLARVNDLGLGGPAEKGEGLRGR
ncbi:MAG: glycosyltransferase [Solidesulfovibrio sp.]